MKLSVFFHHICEAAHQSGKTVPEILEIAKSFGIDYLEFDISDLKNDETAALLADSGMKISSVYGFYDFVNSDDLSGAIYHCGRAAELGSEKIMLIPGFYSENDKSVMKNEREKMLAAMKKVCEYAHEKGLTPTIEDFDDFLSPISTSERMLDFVNEIPYLKVTFDTGNFMYSAESENYAFERLKPYIVHVHCKDRSMTPDERCEMKCAVDGTEMYACPTGDGCVAVAHIVKELAESGYDGIFTIEHFGAYDQLSFMKKSAENLRGMLE